MDHAAAKKATAERHDSEVDAQDASEKAIRGELEAKIQEARSAVKESVASFREGLEAKMARLRADIGRMLSLVADLRSSWLTSASPTTDANGASGDSGGNEAAEGGGEAEGEESSEEEPY